MKQIFVHTAASILLLAVGFVLGYRVAHHNTSIQRIVKLDTIRVLRPLPTSNTLKFTKIFTLPKMLFVQSPIVDNGDSIELTTIVEQREYGDSTYRAWVSGAIIGDCRPTLDSINVFQKTIIQNVPRPPKLVRPFATAAVSIKGQSFSVGGGVVLKEKYGLGLDYNRTDNKDYILLRGIIVF